MAKKKEIKFTQEELDSLSNLRNSFAQLELGFGKLEVARIQAEQRMEQIEDEKLRLETQYSNLINDEKVLLDELIEKYGPGNLDPDTGVFTPIK